MSVVGQPVYKIDGSYSVICRCRLPWEASLRGAGMDPITFQRWLSEIAPLTDPQRRSIRDAIRTKDLEPQMNTDAHG